ncbi:TrmH family RNA methyltransferase [Fervidibacillus halotolerans]|uniref:RNA methyltransferase n=1 Tax=Fervidibacillus halotolerans TaxID=2980027 RepID=A0A9E8LZN0_9BACI|nr:RNA methyltransferase [Fervidibacillus halotolerans]WAA11634.1 RNA methyltransferase [Fervidibacillus halotolerans]
MLIQSPKNEKVKQWKKLLTKKGRDQANRYLVEGDHLVQEALLAGAVEELIITETSMTKYTETSFGSVGIQMISDPIGKILSETETTQGIFAVCKKKIDTKVSGIRFLLIDAVQDPGNLGTMIRTADASGIDAVIIGKGSVDLYNPKVLRAAQGSHFHLPIVQGDLSEWISHFQSESIPVYGTSLQGGESMYTLDPGKPFALIVGNEGRGVHPSLLQQTAKNIFIPIFGKSESLNVSVATGILLYYLRGNDSVVGKEI